MAVKSFNPRTRVGCDGVARAIDIDHIWFQSTHPCGVRRRTPTVLQQPRVSIHAPVWGATAYLVTDSYYS